MKNVKKYGIHLKHKKNTSKFSLKSYIDYRQGKLNVKASEILQELKQQLHKYIIFPYDELYDIVALWIMHTYVYCIFRYVPYIWLNAEAGSGKSTTMDVILEFSFNGSSNVGSTAPSIFRKINNNGATLGLDEFENMTGEEKSLILTVLKVGFKSGGTVTRCDGKDYEPVEFNAFSPKIFAGITEIDNVLLSRCIKINIKMEKDTSKMKEYKNNDIDFKQESAKIRNNLHIFGLEYVDRIYQNYKDDNLLKLEKDYTPRERDLWKPLIAIAKIVDEEGKLTTEESILKYSKILHEELESARYTEIKPRLIKYIEEYIGDNPSIIYPEWYALDELYYFLNETGEFKDIRTFEALGKYLTGFGFEKDRKRYETTTRTKRKTSYHITKEKLNEIKAKNGYDRI